MDAALTEFIERLLKNAEAEGGCVCPTGRPYAVYQARDDEKALYVGYTGRSLAVRLLEHTNDGAIWVGETTKIVCSCAETQEEARAKEKTVIAETCPEYNKRDVPSRCRTVRAIDAFVDGLLEVQ